MAAFDVNTLSLLYAPNRRQWRAWLKKHYKSGKDVWLVYYKKHTGKPRITYNDAVEEALCFGWIDSTVRRIDADRYAQRFSPRKKGSAYSQSNMERLASLAEQGKVMKEVLDASPAAALETFPVPGIFSEESRVTGKPGITSNGCHLRTSESAFHL